jgi:hypothetical protein
MSRKNVDAGLNTITSSKKWDAIPIAEQIIPAINLTQNSAKTLQITGKI